MTGVPFPKWHMAGGLLSASSGDIFSQMLAMTYEKVVRRASLHYDPQLDIPLSYESPRRNPRPCRDQFSSTVGSSIRIVSEVPRTGASSPRPLYLTECLLIGPKENAA